MASFEDRLTALSGPEELKRAKELLKRRAVVGAWRGADRRLHGVFREAGAPPAECEVATGDAVVARCSACPPEKVCAHALALLMYCGRFTVPEAGEEAPPSYMNGLTRRDFSALAASGRGGADAVCCCGCP